MLPVFLYFKNCYYVTVTSQVDLHQITSSTQPMSKRTLRKTLMLRNLGVRVSFVQELHT